MFRMFRNDDTTAQQLVLKFVELKDQLDAIGDVVLTGEYHREMMDYVVQLSHILSTQIDLDDLRWPHMTKLNRIQKLKNKGWYKRHKKHNKGSEKNW